MRRSIRHWFVVGPLAVLMLVLRPLAPSTGVWAQGDEPVALVELGDQLLLQSRFAAAEEAYDAAIDADPEYAVAYAHRCYLRTFQERYQDALADCLQAKALAPDDAEGYIYLARAYDWNGQFSAAIEAGERATALAPEDGLAHSFLGEAYLDVGEWAAGESAVRRGADLAPHEPEVHRNLAFMYGVFRDAESKLRELAAAISLAPEFTPYYRQMALACSNLDQYGQGLDYFQQMLAIAQDVGNRKEEARALNGIGGMYLYQQRFQEALKHFEEALAIDREIGDRLEESKVVHNLGVAYRDLWRLPEALKYLKDALAMERELGHRSGEEKALYNIASVYIRMGRYQEALKYHQDALAIRHDLGYSVSVQASLNDIGAVYGGLGQGQEALRYYEESLALARELEIPAGEATALLNIGNVYFRQEEFQKALEYFKEALVIYSEIDKLSGKRTALNNIAAVYRNQGQYPEALQNLQESLAIAQAFDDWSGEASTLHSIGLVYRAQGEYEPALDYYQQALGIAQEIGSPSRQVGILDSMGHVYYGLGEKERALNFYLEALAIGEGLQGQVTVEEFKTTFAETYQDLYQRTVSLLVELNQPKEAFNYVERARARVFLGQIGNQGVDFRLGARSSLTDQEQKLHQEIIGLQNALGDERAKPFEQQSPSLLDELTQDLEGARRDYDALITRLKLESPEYASLVSVDTLTLDEVQGQVPDEHTTLIEYFILDDRILAWVIDQDDFELMSLDIGQHDLRNQVEFLRKLISRRDFDAQNAASLYESLFAPLKPNIRHANLVIVPHGVLHYLPFAALRDAERERYLIQDYAITYAPSASVLRFILEKRNADEDRLLALGNPDGSLPNAATEVEAISDLYGKTPLLGQQATESQVYLQAGQLDVLHLAAHGVYNPFNPLFTRIELAPDGTHDGNLEVHEVFGLDLTEANLVVLSACETALGEQSEGDELVGLTRAFLYAGTPSVVTTLWSIDDTASGAVMESFYRHLRDGLTNAEALRAAQLAVLAQDKWQTPYYWAGFSLTGDYRGSGEPGVVMGETPEPAAAAVGETPASTPAAEVQPTPENGRGMLCGSAAFPLGIAMLVSVSHRRLRRRS